MNLKMIKFNVAAINKCTEVEGPYKRLTIWFQGCDILCKGCCNPEYQALEIRNLLSLEELIQIISDAKEKLGIEGVTYTGGEPTLQKNLPILTQFIKNLGLGVISFTGRKYEDVASVLKGCDAVFDGAYIESLCDGNRRLLGSSNQKVLCLTKRYKNLENDLYRKDKTVEINIGNYIFANGDFIES